MRITRWGEYGILCCLYLARRFNDGPIGASEIAQTQSIPIKYAQQILHRLRRGGVIKSVRGPHGGFLLAREPMQVNLKEILYAAEGDTFELVCESDPIQHQFCTNKGSCALSAVWRDLKGAVDGVLSESTLASMMSLQDKAVTVEKTTTIEQPGVDGQIVQPGQSIVTRIGSEARFTTPGQ